MKLTIAKLNLDSFAINEGNRTVAFVTPQGNIDWLLVSLDDEGKLITELAVETHLSYTLGLKMLLNHPTPCPESTTISSEILDNGTKVRLVGESVDKKGLWKGRHEAILSLNPVNRRFEWSFKSDLVCLAKEPVKLTWMEYNNVYPSKAGLCMLYEPQKEFDATLMTDKDGTVWKFPHQHSMHYGRKIRALNFAEGTMCGFFGSTMNPVVTVTKSPLEPEWGICDMYYDLHCCSRTPEPIAPGAEFHWEYTVKYLDEKEAALLERKARAIPMEADDYRKHHYPRLALGQNDFKDPIGIDRYDDASCFRPDPPVKVWDKQMGTKGKGSLRITNETEKETFWRAAPPAVIPPGTKLRLTGLVKTDGVAGKGMFIRFRFFRWVWRPTPHVEWGAVMESNAVSGTQDWVQVTTPEALTPHELVDNMVNIDVVLDGKGVAWLSDVGVELQGVEAEVPVTDPVLTE